MQAYFFLLGFLPFVNVARLNPVPSFWVQWVVFFVAAVFTVHLIWLNRARQQERAAVSLLALSLIALSVILLGQVSQGVVASKINALFAVVILLVGACLHHAVRLAFQEVKKERLLSWWSKGVAVALACQMLAATLLWCGIAWVPFHIFNVGVPPRMFGTFGQPNQFGVFVALALSVLLYLTRRQILKEPALFIGWVMAAVLCAASGSRAAICTWLVLALSNLAQEFKCRGRVDLPPMSHGWRLAGLHVLFAVIQFMWAIGLVAMAGVNGVATRVMSDSGGIAARLEQYRDSFALFLDHPISGYGFENFAKSRVYQLSGSLLEPQSTHTHNLLTNALIDYGLLGGVFVVAACIWVVFGAFQVIFKDDGKNEELNLVAVWSLGLLGYAFLEYPFQYIHFFFTFLLITAFLPGWSFKFDRKNTSILRGARLFFLMGAISMSVWVAIDYRRLQNLVLDLEDQVGEFGKVKRPPSLAELTRLRQESLFVRYVDNYWLKSLGLSADIADIKIEVAKSLFEEIPAGDTLAWYAVQLISGQRDDDALALMCNFGRRNGSEFDVALENMRKFSRTFAPANRFLEVNQGQLSKRCR